MNSIFYLVFGMNVVATFEYWTILRILYYFQAVIMILPRILPL